jgi:signal transduction histidine kinase
LSAPAPTRGQPPGTPPWEELRERLLARAAAMSAAGDAQGAAALETLVDAWWREQRAWDSALSAALRGHHEINNALVGISGNAQLLLASPFAQSPEVRERLQVILRETERVERASRDLGEARVRLGFPDVRIGNEGEVHDGCPARSR